jgi:hypothetical protein
VYSLNVSALEEVLGTVMTLLGSGQNPPPRDGKE